MNQEKKHQETFYKYKEYEWIARSRKLVLEKELMKTDLLYKGIMIATLIICLLAISSPVIMKVMYGQYSKKFGTLKCIIDPSLQLGFTILLINIVLAWSIRKYAIWRSRKPSSIPHRFSIPWMLTAYAEINFIILIIFSFRLSQSFALINHNFAQLGVILILPFLSLYILQSFRKKILTVLSLLPIALAVFFVTYVIKHQDTGRSFMPGALGYIAIDMFIMSFLFFSKTMLGIARKKHIEEEIKARMLSSIYSGFNLLSSLAVIGFTFFPIVKVILESHRFPVFDVDPSIIAGIKALFSQLITIATIALTYLFTRKVDRLHRKDQTWLRKLRTGFFTLLLVLAQGAFLTAWTKSIIMNTPILSITVWRESNYVLSTVIVLLVYFCLIFMKTHIRSNSIEFITSLTLINVAFIFNNILFFSRLTVDNNYHWSTLLQINAFVGVLFVLLYISRKLISIFLEYNQPEKQRMMFHGVQKRNIENQIPHLFWTYYLKAASYYYIIFPISLLWLALSTIITFISNSQYIILSIPGNQEFNNELFFQKWINGPDCLIAFFSAFTAAAFTFIYVFQDHHKVLREFTSKTVLDSMLNQMNDHLIIIGMQCLGGNLLRTVFPDIHMSERGHPHKRSISRILFKILIKILSPSGKSIRTTNESERSFRVIVDENLGVYLVSTKVLVIDKDESQFRMLMEKRSDYSVGFYTPWRDTEQILFLAIAGNVVHPTIQLAANFNTAKLIDCTSQDNDIAMSLATLKSPKRKIFSYYHTPLYDVVTALTYQNSTYLIDSASIEGTSVSQRIIVWFMQHLYEKGVIDRHSGDYEKGEYSKMPKILFVGRGKIPYSIIRAIILSMETIGISYQEAVQFLNRSCTIFTDDTLFADEYTPYDSKRKRYRSFGLNAVIPQKVYTKFQNWEFYPLRRHNSNFYRDAMNIPVFYKDLNNFENYAELLKIMHKIGRYPDLIVFLDYEPFGSLAHLNRAINTLEIHQNSITAPLPYIITSASYYDRIFLNEQLMRYLLSNNPAEKVRGFPTPLPIEANLTRDSVASNQNASMVRALLTTQEDSRMCWIKGKAEPQIERRVQMLETEERINHHEAEVTFCLSDNAGSLARLLTQMFSRKVEAFDPGSPRPSFSFCHSFKERHFQQTFIFTGTAYLTKNQSTETADAIDAMYINTSDESFKFYKDALEPFSSRLTGGPKELSCPGNGSVLTDCAISTFQKHTNVPTYQLGRLKAGLNRNHHHVSTPRLPERVHMNIWGDGNDIPGTYCETLCDIMTWKDVTGEQGSRGCLPLIEFTTSIPCGQTNRAQKKFYIRLWDEDKYLEEENKLLDILRKIKEAENLDFFGIKKLHNRNKLKGQIQLVERAFFKSQEIKRFGTILGLKIKKGGGLIDWPSIDDKHSRFDLNKGDAWYRYAIDLLYFLNKVKVPGELSDLYDPSEKPLPESECRSLIDKYNYDRHTAFIVIRTTCGGNDHLCVDEEEAHLKCKDHYYRICIADEKAEHTEWAQNAALEYCFTIEKDLKKEFDKRLLHPASIQNDYIKDNPYKITLNDVLNNRVFLKDLIKVGYELAIVRSDLLKRYRNRNDSGDENDEIWVNNRLFFFDDI